MEVIVAGAELACTRGGAVEITPISSCAKALVAKAIMALERA